MKTIQAIFVIAGYFTFCALAACILYGAFNSSPALDAEDYKPRS